MPANWTVDGTFDPAVVLLPQDDARLKRPSPKSLGITMSEHGQIEGLIHLPIEPRDLLRIELMLTDADLIVQGNYRVDGPVRLNPYLSATHLGGVEFHAVFDRNILSPIVALASGAPLKRGGEAERQVRLACASMAFCILAEIQIEPSLALYEFASSTDHDSADREFDTFRVADNSDLREYINIALGRADRLIVNPSIVLSDGPAREPNFAKRLNRWRPHYLYVLKAYELVRAHGRTVRAGLEFLRWQAEEAFFSNAAAPYCLASMSHRPPKGGMLKSSGAQDPAALKRGIRNATWDVFVLHQFQRKITSAGGPAWSLWTADSALRSIARSIFVGDTEGPELALHGLLERCWGKDGLRLLSAYLAHRNKIVGSPESREKHREALHATIDDQIKMLEVKLGLVTPN